VSASLAAGLKQTFLFHFSNAKRKEKLGKGNNNPKKKHGSQPESPKKKKKLVI
jgi:hypothetical protein